MVVTKKLKSSTDLVLIGNIENSILLIREQRVILDVDLARLYGVPTKRLNEQVKRNLSRFPEDFMFQLNTHEKTQVVAICDHLSMIKFSPTLPFAFSEYGAIMVATILRSEHAVVMSILVVRAFIKLRHLLSSQIQLGNRLAVLERQFKDKTKEHAIHISKIYKILDALMAPPTELKKERIGFNITGKKK